LSVATFGGLGNPVIWKEQAAMDFVGAAFSRDRFNSRLKAAPTGVFF